MRQNLNKVFNWVGAKHLMNKQFFKSTLTLAVLSAMTISVYANEQNTDNSTESLCSWIQLL